jgi:hypothetical protein
MIEQSFCTFNGTMVNGKYFMSDMRSFHGWATSAVFRIVGMALALGGGTAAANTLLYTGLAGDIAPQNLDLSPGVSVFSILVGDPFSLPSAGNNVTVLLTGLQHPFAGDLVFTLSLVVNGSPVVQADIFNRIGKVSTNPDDVGYLTQFGNPFIDSGNYVFNSSFTGPPADLWATAAPLGSSDAIPSGNYWPTTGFSSSVDNLSSAFNGNSIQGTWQLTVLDFGPPGDAFVSSLLSWSLQFEASAATPAPEPAAVIPVAASLALLVWSQLCRKRR